MMSDPLNDIEYWAAVAAEELVNTLGRLGIRGAVLAIHDTGEINLSFPSMADAEAMLTLALVSNENPGSLYDRATSACVTLTGDPEISDDDADRVLADAWKWQIHPAMSGRRMGWHVAVLIPAADVNQLTAVLNTLPTAGAL